MTDPQSLDDALAHGPRLDSEGRLATGGPLDGMTTTEVQSDRKAFQSDGWLLDLLRDDDNRSAS